MDIAFLDFIGRKLINLIRLFGLAFLIAPIAAAMILSFSSTFIIPPDDLTIRWYVNVFTQPDLVNSLKLSIALAISVLVVSTALGTGFCVVIARNSFKGKELITNLALSPLTLPHVAIGISFLLFFIYIGLGGGFIRMLIAHVVFTCPYVIRVVYSALVGFDRSVEESAMNLGATPLETFMEITLPLIKPGILAGAIFAFIVSFNDVTATVFLVDARTVTYPVTLFSRMRELYDPTIAAASVLPIFILLIVLAFLDRKVGLERALGIMRQE